MSGEITLDATQRGYLRAATLLRNAGFADAARYLEDHVWGHICPPLSEGDQEDPTQKWDSETVAKAMQIWADLQARKDGAR